MRIEERIDNFLRLLGEKWKEQGVDLRFTQFLFNNGLVDTNKAYHLEEAELLKQMFPEISEREYTFWGTFGKEGDQPLKYVLIKDMDDEHIASVLNVKGIPDKLRKILEEELSNRI